MGYAQNHEGARLLLQVVKEFPSIERTSSPARSSSARPAINPGTTSISNRTRSKAKVSALRRWLRPKLASLHSDSHCLAILL